MKKIFFAIIAAICCVSLQAQTCKVASTGGKRVIQIEVNLDSLEGRTLVTTIHHVQNNVVLNMSYEGGETTANAAVREDSSELAQNVETQTVAEAETSTTEEAETSTEVAESPDVTAAPAGIFSGAIQALGLSAVTKDLIGKNGEQYLEYQAEEFFKKVTEADSTKYIPEYKQRKWEWLKNCTSYSTLEVSGIFGKDFDIGNDAATAGDESAVNEEDYGVDTEKKYNLGGSVKFSQVFVHGRYLDGKFVPNSLNFAWSLGGLLAMDFQKDYGWSCDIMAKAGIQAGNGITLGADLLIGGGLTPYMIYSTDYMDYRTIRHSQWCFKYGVQGWLSMNYGSNTYTTLFARLVRSVAPSSVYDHPTAKGWENAYIDFDKGSWQVGVAVGYKFGYNADIQSKRLQATTGIGYNAVGVNKGPEVLLEVEKVNKVSPTLDFAYGIGIGQNIGENKLHSFTLHGVWNKRFNPASKLAYLIKIYAGAGEYIVDKHCISEDSHFEMTNSSLKRVCLKGGLGAGICYKVGCSTLSAYLRGGYHHGFDTTYEGFKEGEDHHLKGLELMPVIAYSLQF